MTARRYAEGTSVSVNASQGEIAGILMAHGVRKQGWMTGDTGDELMFELQGHSFRAGGLAAARVRQEEVMTP
jgi:hypothetical protein